MANQPISKAEFERGFAGFTATLAAINAQLTELRAAGGDSNGGEERAQREAPIRVPCGERNRAVVAEDLSSTKKYFKCVQEKKTMTEYTNGCVKQELPKPNSKKEEVIVAEEALEESDELAMLRIMGDDFEEECANGKIGVKSQVLIEDCSDMCCFLNTPVVRASDSQSDPCVSEIIMDLESDEKLSISAMESTFNILKDVKPEDEDNVDTADPVLGLVELETESPLLPRHLIEEEEEKLLEARVKEEIDKCFEQTPQLKDSQFNKLDELLTQTQLYSEFLLEKMDDISTNGIKPEPAEEEGRLEQNKGRGAKRKATFKNKKAKRAVAAMLTRSHEGAGYEDMNLNKEERVSKGQSELVPLLYGGNLKSYQLKGINWLISLWQNGLNGILADFRKSLESCDFKKVSTQWRRVQDRLEDDERCLRLEKVDVDKRGRVKVLKVVNDVIQLHKHGPFKVNEVLHLEKNSGSSSFEVEETDVGAFRAPN
ncbi:unnamed protein product [Rhodiola kirilowii]